MQLLGNPKHIWFKTLNSLHPRRWVVFWLSWCFVFGIGWLWHDFNYGTLYKVFPELGWSHADTFGSVINSVRKMDDHLRISFEPKSNNSQVFGGVLIRNELATKKRKWPSLRYFSIFRDHPIAGGTHLELRVKGKHGGEKLELKLINQGGENWVVLGIPPYVLTDKYQTFRIPIRDFERDSQTSGGAVFNRNDGLEAVVLSANNNLLQPIHSEVFISSFRITNRPRRDWIVGLVVLLGAFTITGFLKFNSIMRSRYHAFISYSRHDKEKAGQLAQQLNNLGLSVWLDSAKLVPGQLFPVSIATGIRACHYFILLASKHSKQSQFVGIEIGMRLKKSQISLLGWEFRLPWPFLSTKNAIVMLLDCDEANVPSVFTTIERLDCASWDPKEAAEKIARIMYLGRIPRTKE